MFLIAGCTARLPVGSNPVSRTPMGRLTLRSAPKAPSTTLFVPASFQRPAGATWRFIVGTGSPDGEAQSEIVVVESRRVVARPAPAPMPTPVRRVAQRRTVQTAVAVPVVRPRAPVATSRLFTRKPQPRPTRPAATGCSGGT